MGYRHTKNGIDYYKLPDGRDMRLYSDAGSASSRRLYIPSLDAYVSRRQGIEFSAGLSASYLNNKAEGEAYDVLVAQFANARGIPFSQVESHPDFQYSFAHLLKNSSGKLHDNYAATMTSYLDFDSYADFGEYVYDDEDGTP